MCVCVCVCVCVLKVEREQSNIMVRQGFNTWLLIKQDTPGIPYDITKLCRFYVTVQGNRIYI